MRNCFWLVIGFAVTTSTAFAQEARDPFDLDVNVDQPPVVVVAPMSPVEPLLQELQVLQQEYRRYRLGGPIALMSTGFGLALVLAMAALLEDVGCLTGCNNRDTQRALGWAALGATVVGVGGLVWMIRRIHQRRPLKTRIRQLRLELRSMGIRASGFDSPFSPALVSF